jgi:DNA repair photolyase
MQNLERKSKFIHKFENKYKTILCPEFYTLGWAHRCDFNPPCAYCYLALTFRYEKEAVIYSNTDKMIEEVKTWLDETKESSVLNCGELADSFMLQENKALADLMDLFERQNKHKLLFLTKNEIIPKEIEENVYSRVYKQTIFSFSVNSTEVSEQWEKGAPNPFKRLATAYRLKKNHQRIRLRVDPIIEINDYEKEYAPVINVINEFVKPERVTLGSLRFFKNLQNFSDSNVFTKAIDNNDEDKRMRIELNNRAEIYRYFIENLKVEDIALCKETLSCHKLLDRKENKCNCMI